jgi:hypothetical protein
MIEDYLARHRDLETRFLAELVKVPSDNPPGDLRAARRARRRAPHEMGFTVERHPVPADLVRANGMISATNLIVRERFGPGPDDRAQRPRRRRAARPRMVDGPLRRGHRRWRDVRARRGRLQVRHRDLRLRAVGTESERRPAARHRRASFHLRRGSRRRHRPEWILKQGLSRPDFAISAGFSYGITTAHNGCLHLEVEIVGRSAHAARPDTGIDALEAATGVLGDLYAIRRSFARTVSATEGIGTPNLTVGLISGGINTNVVPDKVTLRIEPPDHSRREPGGSGSGADAANPRISGQSGPASRATSDASCSRCLSCRSQGRKSWSPPSRGMRLASWARK